MLDTGRNIIKSASIPQNLSKNRKYNFKRLALTTYFDFQIINIFPVNGSVVAQTSGGQISANGSVTAKGGYEALVGGVITGQIEYNRQLSYYIPPTSVMSQVQGYARYSRFLDPNGYARISKYKVITVFLDKKL